jgi:hypothetical protein
MESSESAPGKLIIGGFLRSRESNPAAVDISEIFITLPLSSQLRNREHFGTLTPAAISLPPDHALHDGCLYIGKSDNPGE